MGGQGTAVPRTYAPRPRVAFSVADTAAGRTLPSESPDPIPLRRGGVGRAPPALQRLDALRRPYSAWMRVSASAVFS